MEDEISIFFGTPIHGWLPIKFRYKDFILDFEASDVLNDAIEELFNVINSSHSNEKRSVTW